MVDDESQDRHGDARPAGGASSELGSTRSATGTVDGASDPDGAGTATSDPTWDETLNLLYDEAKRTISEWCRDADSSARAIIADAEDRRRQAHTEADRIREEARLEAGRILASAEAQAGQLRASAQLTGAGRRAEVDALRTRVEKMSETVDLLLDSMESVLAALASLAGPASVEEVAVAAPLEVAPAGTDAATPGAGGSQAAGDAGPGEPPAAQP